MGHALLLSFQIVGISVAVVAAAVDIETILATGPIFSVSGFAIAAGRRSYPSAGVGVFGLSAVATSLFLFVLINWLRWGPSAAEFPVSLILLGYEFVFVPFGLIALHRVSTGQAAEVSPRTWQFNLRWILLVTCAAAIGFAAIKVAVDRGLAAVLSIALGFAAATIIATAAVCGYAWLNHREGEAEAG